MTFPALSIGDGLNSCGAAGNACQNQKTPISSATNLPLKLDEPDASALAPFPAEPTRSVDSVSDSQMMPGRSHDTELFAVPEKKDAIIDPFGKEAGTPLVVPTK